MKLRFRKRRVNLDRLNDLISSRAENRRDWDIRFVKERRESDEKLYISDARYEMLVFNLASISPLKPAAKARLSTKYGMLFASLFHATRIITIDMCSLSSEIPTDFVY